MTYRGHVHHGVIVLDPPVALAEGTPVRVEPLVEQAVSTQEDSRAARYQRLFQLLEKWDTEDEAADARLESVLQQELAEDHGIPFRNESDLERILTQP